MDFYESNNVFNPGVHIEKHGTNPNPNKMPKGNTTNILMKAL
jgi:hypothetical protein